MGLLVTGVSCVLLNQYFMKSIQPFFFRGSLGGSPLLRLENSRNVVVAAACPCGPALEIETQKRYATSVTFYGFYHGKITIQLVKDFENMFRIFEIFRAVPRSDRTAMEQFFL